MYNSWLSTGVRLTISKSLFFSAIKASTSACVFSLAGVGRRVKDGVAVPELVLEKPWMRLPKKPPAVVAVCWRLSRAVVRVFGHGPCADLSAGRDALVEGVRAGEDVQEEAADRAAARAAACSRRLAA